jgi:hypothetical protein
MDNFNLPNDLFEFLITGQQLVYDTYLCEPGEVLLKSYAELKTGVVWVDSQGSAIKYDDPNGTRQGYYEIPAISLTKESEHYDPEYLLMWLPQDRLYGSWDNDHWNLIVFPHTRWDDIAEDPVLYLNALWENRSHVGVYFQPWLKYDFKSGRPF